MSEERDKNPRAVGEEVTFDSEEEEILDRVANQTHELGILRTELLIANRKINDLTLRLLGNEETPDNAMAPVTSTPRRACQQEQTEHVV